jgi:DNA repair protein RecN (Recombination protein N)
MLRYLKISNLAIIDQVEVEFQEGLNVLTGETGAGKSILIGALNLLLGAKGSPDIIRTGEDEAHVEGLFEIPDEELLQGSVADDLAGGGDLVISRRFFRSGRSRCFINGNLSTVATLQSIASSLVNIFGQHEHQSLLDSDEHLELLDRFGELEARREFTAESYSEANRAARNLAKAQTRLTELLEREEENEAAIEELAAANLQEDEEEKLPTEKEVLKKAVQIREKAFEAHQSLYSRSGSILEDLSDVRKAVDYLASINPALVKLSENLQEALYRLEDVALELRHVADDSHGDPSRLEQIEERLALLRRLKKKYGTDIPGLLALSNNLAQEAGDILEARARIKKLSSQATESREAFLHTARELSKARRKAGTRLQAAMKKELKDLAMERAVFEVRFEELGEEHASGLGLEKAEFFLASNPGETPRPLAKVASGGELSRVMLAIKALQVYREPASTVIFDEVDAGIGGHTAFAVGTRLARVAERQQLLCVTHLHQVAAMANHHLSVTKSVSKGRTRIEVRPLSRDERVEELARMLGASPVSDSVREHVMRLMADGELEASS